MMSENSEKILLKVENLDVSFFSGRTGKFVHAVNDVSFDLHEGEFLGLVGESGCGKSTIAKMVVGLVKPDGGKITLNEKEIRYPYQREVYRTLQMIYQMPQDSFDPRRKIGNCIVEIQTAFGKSREEAKKKTLELLHRVGLTDEYFDKYPHEMSGGECQRAAIARSLSLDPKIIICDEITSALDVSVQAQVVELLLSLKKELNISLIFISHDLALVQGLCDHVMVMYSGQIVERGETDAIMHHPQKEYTKLLINSVLEI